MSQDRIITQPGRRTWPDRATDGIDPRLRFSAKFEGAEPLGSSSSNRLETTAIAVSAALLGEVPDDAAAEIAARFPKQFRQGRQFLRQSTEGDTPDRAEELRDRLMR